MDKKDRDMEKTPLSRRGFLKLPVVLGGAAALGQAKKYLDFPEKGTSPESSWPSFDHEDLPPGEIKEILRRIPNIVVDSEGFVFSNRTRVPFAETDWSRENRRAINPDALVVHWYGQSNPQEARILGIMSGYNEVRRSTDGSREFRTSAHVTIGPYTLSEVSSDPESHVSILQTQAPREGYPTVSSHLISNLTSEHQAYLNAQHPINTMQLLFPYYSLPRTYNYLPNVLRGSGQDLNLRTISLELLGVNFDSETGHPEPQLVANTLAVILAHIKRYPDIKFSNINGHYEIQMDKADPGKNFMGELRLLLALKVLEGNNTALKENLFGPFMTESRSPIEAVKRFFDFHWDYFVASNWGHPKKVYEWEGRTGFWKIYRSLFEQNPAQIADRFVLPVLPHEDRRIVYGSRYAEPEYHEGVDLNIQATRTLINEDLGEPVHSTANGKVVFTSEIPGRPGLGNTAVIEHILPDGAKVLSLYAHLDEIRVNKDQIVEINEQIATMGNSGGQPDSHLHFAIFPAASKRKKELDHYLQLRYEGQPVDAYTQDEEGRIFIVPATVRREYIESYYFDPLVFISENS